MTVKLPVLGAYSPTAPYNCPKSKLILEQGCKALAERIQQKGYDPNPISRPLNALALLESLLKYGAHAQAKIPELEKIAAQFDAANTYFPAHLDKLKAQMVRDAIKEIEASTEKPKLISIH